MPFLKMGLGDTSSLIIDVTSFQVPKFQVFVATRANNTHKSRVKTSSREK